MGRKKALTNSLGKTRASVDDADHSVSFFDRDRHLNGHSIGRNLGRIFYQIREGGAYGSGNDKNLKFIITTPNPNLGSLLNRLEDDSPYQIFEISLLGLSHLLGTEGEEGPQPTIDPSNLGPRGGYKVLPFLLA